VQIGVSPLSFERVKVKRGLVETGESAWWGYKGRKKKRLVFSVH
jgi:hypothetical protein